MTFEDRFCEANGRRVRYLAAGSGPAVVLVHAAGESASDWQWVMSVLARTHRVYAPDLYPGDHPHSAANYSSDALSRLMAAFLTALGIDRAAVVGSSLGGLVALRLALACPGRVMALGLIDGAGLGRAIHPAMIMSVTPAYADVAVTWCKTPLGALQRVWTRALLLFTHPERISPAWYSEQYRLSRLPYFLDAVLASLRAQVDLGGQREVLLHQLAALPMPIMIIWGEDDRVFPTVQAKEAARRLRKGNIVIVPECGHLPHVEQPVPCADALVNFLQAVRPTETPEG